jgi:diaminopimelate epimerase
LKLQFYKYQGTGNDFIILDNREELFRTNDLNIPGICDRRFGIGADGLIVIENHPTLDFHMIYFNADGTKSFCGNGSRCAVIFAKFLGLITASTIFLSTDGVHEAEILSNGEVKLKMHDVEGIKYLGHAYELNTGSPHYVTYYADLENLDILPMARSIRYNEPYTETGINVNFIHPSDGGIGIRTYERGVEDETLSCGTGVTASALVHHVHIEGKAGNFVSQVISRGGALSVHFAYNKGIFTDIYLQGPATFVFEGEVTV